MKRNILFAAVSVLAVLGGIELVLRLAGFRYESFYDCPDWWSRCGQNPIFEGDPTLFWKLRPLANSDLDPKDPTTQSINSAGFRNAEFPIEKKPGEFRIIAMGDSCTFGDGVANWEAYPEILEKLIRLASPTRSVRVINAGVPGYTAYQVQRYLNERLIQYQPDLVTLYVGFNDNIPAPRGLSDRDLAWRNHGIDQIRKVFWVSRDYQLLNRAISHYKRKISNAAPTPFPSTGQAWTSRVSEEEFLKRLCHINELGKEKGFQTVVMTLPHSFEKEPDYNGQIRAAAKQCGVQSIDLWQTMKSEQRKGVNLYQSDGGHPNATGHRIIASSLFGKLQEMGVLAAGAVPELPAMPVGSSESHETEHAVHGSY